MGGLGNQLFQYAFAYAYFKKRYVNVFLDTSFYSKNKSRRPLIINMPISHNRESKLSNRKLIKILNFKLIRFFIKFFRIQLIKFKNFFYIIDLDSQTKIDFPEILNTDIYFIGYWQNPKFFQEHYKTLKREFIPANISNKFNYFLNKFNNYEICSIHVRRGDYLNLNKYFTKLELLKDSYFHSAIEKILKTKDNVFFFIFTDDLLYCKNLFSSYKNLFFIGDLNLSDLDEFYLMTLCNHNIISNSTFSWWAAYLNSNPSKIIIAPLNGWIDNNILPIDWIKIS